MEPEELTLRVFIYRFLERVGHLWVENTLSIIVFPWRLLRAIIFKETVATGGTGWELWVMILQQIGRTLLRGIVPTIGIGIIVAVAIGSISRDIGSLVRPLFETTALVVFFRNILPLLLLLIVILRNGASIAAKFASMPADVQMRLDRGRIPKEELSFQGDALLRHALPHILASTLAALPLFAILVHCSMAGYLSQGTLEKGLRTAPVDTYAFLELQNLLPSFGVGLAKSTAYSFIVAWVSLALGIQAAERVSKLPDEEFDFFNAVWESGVTALLLCLIIAIATWTNQ